MAYRRRNGIARSTTFKEEIRHHPPPEEAVTAASYASPSSLAAQAIRASSNYRDSSNSSANAKGGTGYDYRSMDSSNGAGGFWEVLARKAKSILEEDNAPYLFDEMPQSLHSSSRAQKIESSKRIENNPSIRKGLNVFASSMNRIGDTIGNALEEGRNNVENKTADLIQETRKLQIGRNGTNTEDQNPAFGSWKITQTQNQTSQEDLLKASRDVAMATAAKAKLLLRELKTVKADLAFAKQRCSQLEEENKILRDAREKGVNPADDDMIRLQLETLLAEKARLANENSFYARENRFLREIVEYHQLTMQDVVYLDEGIEEVTEVYPVPAVSRMLSLSPPPLSPISRSQSCISLLLKEQVPIDKEPEEPTRH